MACGRADIAERVRSLYEFDERARRRGRSLHALAALFCLLVLLGIGVAASLLAVVPLLGDPTADAPLVRLALLSAGILASGMVWILAAVFAAADRDPATGLRAD